MKVFYTARNRSIRGKEIENKKSIIFLNSCGLTFWVHDVLNNSNLNLLSDRKILSTSILIPFLWPSSTVNVLSLSWTAYCPPWTRLRATATPPHQINYLPKLSLLYSFYISKHVFTSAAAQSHTFQMFGTKLGWFNKTFMLKNTFIGNIQNENWIFLKCRSSCLWL